MALVAVAIENTHRAKARSRNLKAIAIGAVVGWKRSDDKLK